jgi:hypothetical protein
VTAYADVVAAAANVEVRKAVKVLTDRGINAAQYERLLALIAHQRRRDGRTS